jgi:hypothetical protein
MAMASFWGSLSQTKMMRICTRQRERERSRKGAAEQPDLTGIRSPSSQQWRKPASNSAAWQGQLALGKKERREGSEEVL